MSRKRKHGAGRPQRNLPRLVCCDCGKRYRSAVRRASHRNRCAECSDAAYQRMAQGMHSEARS